MRWAWALVVVAGSVGICCGGDTEEDAAHASPPASTEVAGAGGAELPVAAGAGGSGGTGWSPPDCPVINCPRECPFGLWGDAYTECPTCYCAPPREVAMQTAGEPVFPQYVSLETTLDTVMGAQYHYTFDFTWRYDDPDSIDEEVIVEAVVGFRFDGIPTWTVGSTYLLPDEAATIDATVSFGSETLAPPDLQIESGYLSARIEGARVVGGVRLTLPNDTFWPGEIVVDGTFNVPSPY